ncbi:unnamed protein product [Parnassius mnemosyne]|uniref:Uncharacterized protein n=1 Tax=Parnassius mnemosyne TaxID=213953 RepID=A0AAV1LTZ3_9NEOP
MHDEHLLNFQNFQNLFNTWYLISYDLNRFKNRPFSERIDIPIDVDNDITKWRQLFWEKLCVNNNVENLANEE